MKQNHPQDSNETSGTSSGCRTRVSSDLMVTEDETSSLEQFEDEISQDDPSIHFPTFDSAPILSDGDEGEFSIPTPLASGLIDLSETSLTSKGSYHGIVLPEDPFVQVERPLAFLSDRTIQNSVRKVLDHSASFLKRFPDRNGEIGDETEPFRPPHLAKPHVVTDDDRCITPQSWQTELYSRMPNSPDRRFNIKFPSAPASPMSPMSKVSLRTARSETYFHTYEADPKAPPKPVPPFVVVHNTGHAFVKVTPRGNDLKEDFIDEEEQSTTSSLLSWKSFLQPIVMLVAGGVVILAAVTVAAGLLKSRQDKTGPISPPSFAPTGFSNEEFPTSEPFLNQGAENVEDQVVKVPYQETTVPTQVTTRPPRTLPPSVLEGNENDPPSFPPSSLFTSSVPSSEESFPWNNYVIGLLSVESPETFEKFQDTDSPQYKALKWLSMEMSQEEGTISFSQESSLQRFGLLCFWYATGGSDWKSGAGWLNTGSNECSWEGITCDNSQSVIAMTFVANDLTGSLPIEIKLLKNLQTVALSQNSIGGRLPAALAENLELEELNVSYNSLTGSLPEEYGGLDLLRTLDVSQNGLTGTIPSAFGSMVNLEVLNLCANDFSGSIPSQMGSLSFLQSLNLGRNERMFGIVPEAVCDLGSSISRGAPPEVVVDCSLECECCVQCCDSTIQPRSVEGCCSF